MLPPENDDPDKMYPASRQPTTSGLQSTPREIKEPDNDYIDFNATPARRYVDVDISCDPVVQRAKDRYTAEVEAAAAERDLYVNQGCSREFFKPCSHMLSKSK